MGKIDPDTTPDPETFNNKPSQLDAEGVNLGEGKDTDKEDEIE